MAIEIERKFLVKSNEWRTLGTGTLYRQGYIATQDKTTTVQVRIVDDHAYLTIKGKTAGYARAEFEYPIPLADAQMMLDTLCDRPLIEKIRYRILLGNLVWEIDEFRGDNEGLVIAEIELVEENQIIELPAWIDQEVTHDLKYYNVSLAKFPYCQWQRKEFDIS